MSNLVTFIFMEMRRSWTGVFISGDTHEQIMNANVLIAMVSVMDCLFLRAYQSNNILFLASTKCPRLKSSDIYVHRKCLEIYTVPSTMLLVMNLKDKAAFVF